MNSQPSAPPGRWRFGPFDLDVSTRELRKNGLRVRIQEQPGLVLEALVSRAGEVITREELRQRLWPGDTHVEFERGLNTAVAKLRQALADSAEQPRYVETVARRGYRFIGRVEPCPTPSAESVPEMPVTSRADSLASTPKVSRWIWLAVAGLVAVLSAILNYSWKQKEPPPAPRARFVLAPPRGTQIHPVVAVSPDGRKLAFVVVDSSGRRALYVRALDSEAAIRLDHTDGAIAPFFSPDSSNIAFFADEKLKRIVATGGVPQSLCGTMQPAGGAWNRDGVVLFSDKGRLYRVAASGGEPVELPRPSARPGEQAIDTWPQFLPDGSRFIVSTATHAGQINAIRAEIFLGSLGSEERRFLVNSRSRAVLTNRGRLMFRRDDFVVAQQLELNKAQLVGEPVIVAQDLNRSSGGVLVEVRPGLPVGVMPANFSASDTGVLVFHSSPLTRKQLVWFDRKGNRLSTAGEPADYTQMSVSPDEQYVALAARTRGAQLHWNLWLLQLKTNVLSQLSFGEGRDADPAWSPDSARVVYGAYDAQRGEQIDLMEVKLGERAARRFYADGNANKPEVWSPDGSFLLVRRNEQDVFILPVSGEQKPTVLMQSPHLRSSFRFSPDGRRIAYVSTQSGSPEIYLSRFPEMTETRQVSAGGGFSPTWRKDGKELFYMSRQGFIMSVGMQVGSKFEPGAPTALFRPEVRDINMPQFTSTDNAKRFLVLEAVPSEAADDRLVVMTNWAAAINP